MVSRPSAVPRTGRIWRAIKRNPAKVWFINLLWPRSKLAPTNPVALRVERWQVIGLAFTLLAVLIVTTTILVTAGSGGATPVDAVSD